MVFKFPVFPGSIQLVQCILSLRKIQNVFEMFLFTPSSSVYAHTFIYIESILNLNLSTEEEEILSV